MTPNLVHDPDRAEDIVRELMEVCRKRKCVLLAGNGVFYLARVDVEEAKQHMAAAFGTKMPVAPIAQIREINPGVAEWMPTETETKVTKQ